MNVMIKNVLLFGFYLIFVCYWGYVARKGKKEKNDERWQLIDAKSDSITLKLTLPVAVALAFLALNIPLTKQNLSGQVIAFCVALPLIICLIKIVALKVYEHQL
ncbi:hypothetical protein EQ500_08330 [Lactobacillus sp. XV13L]|nr:hypothetical protein [Lactobacillus sp. XV13L]